MNARMKTLGAVILLLFLLIIPAVQAEDSLEWYLKGQDAARVGNYADALIYYNNAIAQNNNFAAAYAGKAAALNRLGRYDEAMNAADKALAIKMDADALNARAFALFKLGRYDEAVTAYDNVFTAQMNRPDAYCNQGAAYEKINKTDKALVAYQQCAQLDPGNADTWNSIGLLLTVQKKYPEALSAFDHATKITINNAEVWNNKGVVLVSLQRYQDALQCFNKALGLKPDYTEARQNKDAAMSKGQVFVIAGTVTPVETGSYLATPTPTTTAPGLTPAEITTVQTLPVQSEIPTTVPDAQKTTYSPLSPIGTLAAVIAVGMMVLAINRKRQ